MPDFDTEKAIDLMLSGASPEQAVATMIQDPGEAHADWVTDPGGDLTNIPDPACIARHLAGIANPTREDLAHAIAQCSG